MNLRTAYLVPFVATTAFACSSPPHSSNVASFAPPPVATSLKPTAVSPRPTPPSGLRLPRTVRPLRYEATLTLVPSARTLEGDITLELSLAEPSRVIWLHAEGLSADKATFSASDKERSVEVISDQAGLLGFVLDSEANAGPARLSIHYQGQIRDNDDHGAFQETFMGSAYVFSQFESTSARRVFPCFDDPGEKVPWKISLRVPEGDTALSNTPMVSESKEAGGKKLVHFAQTRPLPSYLVAFAVGPFEFVDGGTAGAKKVPVRIVVPRGEKAKAGYAAKITAPVLGLLEDYMGTPYPYEKLDIVAVPQLATFGAMENPGLVTYGSSGLLALEADETRPFRRGLVGTMAHELAHQWFGDSVTMDFWEDIWLNEAFATWMGSKILERFSPSWHEDTRRVGADSYAMGEDSLVSARKIRQEILAPDDIVNAFDGITYSKGAAVLRMFEAYVGPEKFQRGVRRYLGEHADGNAKSADFLSALSAETDPSIGPAFTTFLDQPGVPIVHTELSCGKGKPPSVKLSQSRFFPTGSTGKSMESWQIPVCLHFGGAAEGRVCTLLKEKTAEVQLPNAKACPDWVSIKEGGRGYYRADHGKAGLLALLDKHKKSLSLPERLALLADAEAFMTSGALTPADVLALVPGLMKEAEPQLEQSAVGFAFGVREAYLPEALRPKYAQFIVKTFGKRAQDLGYTPKKGEDEDIAQLRPMLSFLVAARGEDQKTQAAMRAVGTKYLSDPASTTPDLAGPALFVMARHGDRAVFDQFIEALKKETDARRRFLVIQALANFRDPTLSNASLDILLKPETDPRETFFMLAQDERMLGQSLAFLEKNWKTLSERMPGEALGFTPSFYSRFCDEQGRDKLNQFFSSRAKDIVGAPRSLAQSLESIDLCISQKKAYEPSLRAFLAKY